LIKLEVDYHRLENYYVSIHVQFENFAFLHERFPVYLGLQKKLNSRVNLFLRISTGKAKMTNQIWLFLLT